MRRQNLATASLAVWIETNSFKPNEWQYNASKAGAATVATANTGKLIAAATAGLGIIFKPAIAARRPAPPSSISWRPIACKRSLDTPSPAR